MQQDGLWFRADETDPHIKMTRLIKAIRDAQPYRRELDLRHARLYGNTPFADFGVRGYARPLQSASTPRLSLNIVKNMVDAATSKITKPRPKPTFLTSGGDYTQTRKAKLLDKFCEGQFYESNVYAEAAKAVMDAGIYGTGVLKVFRDGDSIRVERVYPWELVVDDATAMYGAPRAIFQRRYADRYVLAELFPASARAIRESSRQDDDEASASLDIVSDAMLVHEGWHLPSGAGAKDGRHLIATSSAKLLSEPCTEFPFVFIRWSQPHVGFFGVGIAEQLVGIQLEVNKLLREVQRAHHLIGKAHWMVDNASKVVSAHIDNDIGSIIRYSGGQMPQVYTPQAVHPEIYSHLWNLVGKSYEITGISQLSAQSQKPAGLNSGRALTVFTDIESERFMAVGREYENLFLGIARKMIRLGQEIAEDVPTYSVRASSKSVFEKIAWKDVDLTEDDYVMKIFPTSALAQEPAARLEQVQAMANAGWLEMTEAKRLLDFPDLEATANLEQASYDLVQRMIEEALDRGVYIQPEPFMDMQRAKRMVQLACVKAQVDGVDEERSGLLRQMVVAMDELLKPPAMMAPTESAPPSPDMPPPSPDAMPAAA